MNPLKKPVAHQVIIPKLPLHDEERRLVDKALIKLLTGAYGGDFEKLPPTQLYSMRLEGKGRILLAKSVMNGVATLILVECLFEHEYVQSRCLNFYKPRELHQHIERCAQGFVYVLNQESSALVLRDKAAAPRASATRLLEYGGRYIEASEAQDRALLKRGSPSTEVVYGEAGSGKTLLLMSRLSSLAGVLATDESSTRTIWVLVPHRPLHQHLELEWSNQSVYHEITSNPQLKNPVRIVTPDSFYRQLDRLPARLVSKDYSEFCTWLSEEYFAKMKVLFGPLSRMQVYQELCIFNGLIILQGAVPGAQKLYEAAELSPAYLATKDRKKAAHLLVDLLKAYQAHLQATNGFDAYVYQPRTSLPKQDYFFADEAQNLPPGLLVLPNAFIAMNDSQSIRFKRRVNELLLTALYKKTIPYSELPGSHRSPKQPIQLASRVDAFVGEQVHRKRKQASTSSPLKSVNLEEGLVCFVEGSSVEELNALKQAVQEPDTAVVYLSSEAEKEFKDLGIEPLCAFNKDNPILGLEFKRVIIATPFSSLSPPGSAYEKLTANQIAELELYLNNLKAAMTRATDSLVVFQPKTHETKDLLAFFKEGVVCSSMQAMDKNDTERRELLYEQACWLYDNGQWEMAFGIVAHLNIKQEDFLGEVRSNRPAPREEKPENKPDDPAPVSNTLSFCSVPALAPIKQAKPLTKALTQYVEDFYIKPSENNLKKLLVHERAGVMLFHHKMSNGQCLFLNLLFAHRLIDSFRSILQQAKTKEAQAVISACASIPEQDYFLRFALSSIVPDALDLQQSLSFAQIQKTGLGCLLVEGSSATLKNKVKYLVQGNYPLSEDDLTHQYRQQDNSLTYSIVDFLAANGTEWPSFFKNGNSSQYSILRKILACLTKETYGPNDNLILSLVKTTEGAEWIVTHLKALAPYVKGDLLFALLCTGGASTLETYWSDFKKYLGVERLFVPATIEGPEQGKISFYWLSGSHEGSAFLFANWYDFKKYLSRELLFSRVTNERVDKGASSFYWFCSISTGRTILTKHWNDFKDYLNAENLFAPILGDGVFKGASAFYWLCGTSEGRVLLLKHWSDFKRHLSAAGLFAPVISDGAYQGSTDFHLLCRTPEGRSILAAHWSDFKKHLNSDGLFSPVSGKGAEQGKSPFYGLCSSVDGCALLIQHWDDFKGYLNSEGLFTPVTVDGQEKGVSAFSCLCATVQGRALLIEHWDDFKKHILIKELLSQLMECQANNKETLCSMLNGIKDGRALLTRLSLDFPAVISSASIGFFAEPEGKKVSLEQSASRKNQTSTSSSNVINNF